MYFVYTIQITDERRIFGVKIIPLSMLQYIIVGVLLIWAVFYIVRSLRNQFKKDKGCASNCKCGIDFEQINTSNK